MLVLSRKIGEAIYIGDIKVVITDVDRGKVRLGIEAPKSVPVDREEVWLEKQAKIADQGLQKPNAAASMRKSG